MESLFEQIERGALWQFPGGIHPPEQKTLSNQLPIRQLPLPDKLVIPLKQHIGANGQLLVHVGDHVLKGQALTKPAGNWSLPIHAATSGTITAIEHRPSAHPSALPEPSIVLEPDGQDTWCALEPLAQYKDISKQQLVDKIHDAGIAGMGGAGFPTYVKASSQAEIDFFVVNGVECEPYITADDMLMREHAEQIVQGIEIMQHLLAPKYVLVGIEDNKPEAIAAMQKASAHNDKILVRSVPTKYPSGGEKQLIKVLTSREVPSAGIPADIGVLVQNVGTLFAISDAVLRGKPLIERVVTVTGNTIKQAQNVWALMGTEIKHLLDSQKFEPVTAQRVIMGGPMMGFTLPTVRIPVVKTTNCILAPDNQELAEPNDEKACIRCSACADACPQTLLPQQLQWFAKGKEYQKLEEYNLFDCIECGACSYVCPSEIPLVQYYRVAKAEIREQKLEQIKAERAKERFEARKERLEREQEERQNRHKRSASRSTQSAQSKEKVAEALERVKSKKAPEKSAVEAAIARAKAKKAADGSLEPDNSAVALERAKRKEQARQYKAEKATDDSANKPKDNKAAVAAAIARAKAKKAAQQSDADDVNTEKQATQTDASTDPRKAAVAAAIARAKAKKATQNAVQDEAPTETESIEDPRKAAVAAAIARAKAKKAAQSAEQDEAPTETESTEDPRKAAVAAATARAKAKKATKEAEQSDEAVADSEPEDPRKAAVAAAIARAKAKKAAKEAEQSDEAVADSEPEDPRKAAVAAAIARAKAKEAEQSDETVADSEPEDPRKAAVAAAIARAKAKKAAKEAEQSDETVADSEPEDPRKAAVAAAIARAKAKKAAKEAELSASEESDETDTQTEQAEQSSEPEDPRKAAVAAAIARAKAKKAAKEAQIKQESEEGNEPS